MKNLFIGISILAVCAVLFSCGMRQGAKDNKGLAAADGGPSAPALRIEMQEVDSVRIICRKDVGKEKFLPRTEAQKIVSLLAGAEYDSKWNDSGIMVKMVEPDFTLILTYRAAGKPDKWLMLWREGMRVKFGELWYLLPAGKSEEVFSLLDRYDC